MGHVYFCFASAGDEATVEDWAVCEKTAPAAQIVSKIDRNKIFVLKV